MITQYYRPQTLEEALQLLARADTRPLGGGTVLTQRSNESFSVVDLQALGLDKLHKSGDNLEIGATVTLQNLLEVFIYCQSAESSHRTGNAPQLAYHGNRGRYAGDM